MFKRDPYRSRHLDPLFRLFGCLAVLFLLFGVYRWFHPAYEESDIRVTFDYGDRQYTKLVGTGLLEEPKAPTLEGYYFDGWYLVEGERETLWNFACDEVVGDMTLRARFLPVYHTVILDPNGGRCEKTTVLVYPDERYSFSIPEREGYYFAGWYWGTTRWESSGIWSRNGPYSKEYRLTARWTTFAPGMTLSFGTYEQDDDPRTVGEPIEWIVWDYRDGKYFLVSRYLLAADAYDGASKNANDWESCRLRAWLNEDFYQVAFSEEEKHWIAESVLTDVGTTDRVFVPSYPEIGAYFLKRIDGYGIGTDHALANGLVYGSGDAIDHARWWLRGNGTHFLTTDGKTYYSHINGASVNGIRPAMWVSEEAFEETTE